METNVVNEMNERNKMNERNEMIEMHEMNDISFDVQKKKYKVSWYDNVKYVKMDLQTDQSTNWPTIGN